MYDAAQVLGGFATAFGISVALFSAVLIFYQTISTNRTTRHAAALSARADYIKFCMEHPEYSNSRIAMHTLKIKNFDSILENNTRPDVERALWFLSYVLNAMEQLLNTAVSRKERDAWEQTAIDQLRYHAGLLSAVWPQWRRHYGSHLQKVIDQIIIMESHQILTYFAYVADTHTD
jgi:hypothetical protein